MQTCPMAAPVPRSARWGFGAAAQSVKSELPRTTLASSEKRIFGKEVRRREVCPRPSRRNNCNEYGSKVEYDSVLYGAAPVRQMRKGKSVSRTSATNQSHLRFLRSATYWPGLSSRTDELRSGRSHVYDDLAFIEPGEGFQISRTHYTSRTPYAGPSSSLLGHKSLSRNFVAVSTPATGSRTSFCPPVPGAGTQVGMRPNCVKTVPWSQL